MTRPLSGGKGVKSLLGSCLKTWGYYTYPTEALDIFLKGTNPVRLRSGIVSNPDLSGLDSSTCVSRVVSLALNECHYN